MIGRGARAAFALVAAAALSGCVAASSTPGPGAQLFDTPPAIAAQRVAFAAEAVCVQNRTPGAQRAAANRLGFPDVQRRGAETFYVNPATATFLGIGPVPPDSITLEDGRVRSVAGSGCWVGSPELSVRDTNRIAAGIVTSRVFEASALTREPLASGENAIGGIGLFFERLTMVVAEVTTVLSAPEIEESFGFSYPIILVRHTR